jgi:hypothetical protein
LASKIIVEIITSNPRLADNVETHIAYALSFDATTRVRQVSREEGGKRKLRGRDERMSHGRILSKADLLAEMDMALANHTTAFNGSISDAQTLPAQFHSGFIAATSLWMGRVSKL